MAFGGYDSFEYQQNQQRYADVQKAQREDERRREKERQKRAQQREIELQERIARNLEQVRQKKAEREAERDRQHEAFGEAVIARVEAKRAGRPYVRPKSSSAAANGTKCYLDPVSLWKAAIAEAKKRNSDPVAAVRSVVRKNPGLREAMLKAVNG